MIFFNFYWRKNWKIFQFFEKKNLVSLFVSFIYFLSLMKFSKLRTLQGQRWMEICDPPKLPSGEGCGTYLENVNSNYSLFNLAWTPFHHLFYFLFLSNVCHHFLLHVRLFFLFLLVLVFPIFLKTFFASLFFVVLSCCFFHSDIYLLDNSF